MNFPPNSGDLRFKLHETIDGVSAAAWDALGGAQHPFCRHAFLQTLERTGCVGASTGWRVRHATVERDGQTVLALPLYEKSHSRGEYVFDYSWADAWQRCGLRYYPKWLTAIPFTPIVGPRLLRNPVADELDMAQLRAGLASAIAQYNVSGWHILFPDNDSTTQLAKPMSGLLSVQRHDVQFHWHNRGYRDFADFLDTLRSSKRKQIRRERAKVSGITFRRLHGYQMQPAQWQSFYQCYCNTYHERGMSPYLSEAFFSAIADVLGEHMLIVEASYQERPIAWALYFFDGKALYGRYWGSHAAIDGLHFECCYYQGIEFCIERQLPLFNAGAQGEHKIARGFEPVVLGSLHHLRHGPLDAALQRFCAEEKRAAEDYVRWARERLPFAVDDR